ncbi:MAG: copper-binding protein [Betaproteobacteria bacterium]|nr:copper-binding protein [Betaproteobacteria bacterium]
MKIAFSTACLILTAAFSAPGFAADDHAGHGAMHATAPATAAMIDGLVKKVDKPSGKVTVSHGPLPNGMPAMTMVFRVKDTAWLDQMKDGDKIRFTAADVNGAMTLVHFEKTK